MRASDKAGSPGSKKQLKGEVRERNAKRTVYNIKQFFTKRKWIFTNENNRQWK